MERKTKKDMYNESILDLRTYINGETAIKPYYYYRNGLLHVRYTVDRCIQLSDTEKAKLKMELTVNSTDKQSILEKYWNFFTTCVGKEIIADGVAEMEKRIKEYSGNGRENQSSKL